MPVLLSAMAAVLLIGWSAPPAHAAQCRDVLTRYIDATNVRTEGGLKCWRARPVLRRYFRSVVNTGQVNGGCAQKRWTSGCVVDGFRCFIDPVRYDRGRCVRNDRVVRFNETDRGPE